MGPLGDPKVPHGARGLRQRPFREGAAGHIESEDQLPGGVLGVELRAAQQDYACGVSPEPIAQGADAAQDANKVLPHAQIIHGGQEQEGRKAGLRRGRNVLEKDVGGKLLYYGFAADAAFNEVHPGVVVNGDEGQSLHWSSASLRSAQAARRRAFRSGCSSSPRITLPAGVMRLTQPK